MNDLKNIELCADVTRSPDQICDDLAFFATQSCKFIFADRRCGWRMTCKRITNRVRYVVEAADKIIALRELEAVPFTGVSGTHQEFLGERA